MQAPRLKKVKNSEHPDAEIQYDIVVKFTIAPDGKISEIEVVSSFYMDFRRSRHGDSRNLAVKVR